MVMGGRLAVLTFVHVSRDFDLHRAVEAVFMVEQELSRRCSTQTEMNRVVVLPESESP